MTATVPPVAASAAEPGVEGALPLTAAQRGLYFAHELAPDNPCYTTAELVELDGAVDAEALVQAHRRAYAEFEQLHVRFSATADGPRQRIVGAPPVRLRRVDVPDEQAAEKWLAADLAVPMVLDGRGAPGGPEGGADVLRCALLRFPDGRCWWYHAAHHVLLDGYGAQQLLRRIAEHYDAVLGGTRAATPVVSSLADVVAEAGELEADDTAVAAAGDALLGDAAPGSAVLGDDVLEDDVLGGVVALAGRAAPAQPRAVRAAGVLDEHSQTALVRGARRLGVGWTDLVLAAIGSYLARTAGLSATRIGVPLMNRTVPGRGQLASARTVCTAMNVLPLTVPGRGPLSATVTAVAAGQRGLREHAFVRQEALQRHLSRRHAGAQLFGAQVNLVPFDLEVRLGGVPGRVRNLTAGPVEDMTVGLRGTPGRGRAVRLEIDANPRLYDEDELAAHLARLTAWLVTFAEADPDVDVDELPLLTPAEQRRLESFNDTGHPHRPRTLARRFVDQARATPDASALVYDGRTRSYAELLAAATRIAGGLRARGVRAGDVVGVELPRGFGLYETVHAISLLGAVYLPVDPDLPAQRRALMLQDARASLVVTDADALAVPVRPSHDEVREPDGGMEDLLDDEGAGLAGDVDAAAYLLFTSGSTGRPKGVLVSHAAIDNRLRWMQHHFALQPGERVLHKTPISFDVSVWELFWPLQVGGTVVIAEPGGHRDPRRIADLVVEQGVGTLHFVPSMLRAFLADRASRERMRGGPVHTLVCSGEALTPDLVTDARDVFGVAPTNLYGPTEAAVDVTVWECAEAGESAVPIGRPIWNTTCHVLDPRGRVVPIGSAGELWLGGVQLALGYVGRDDLTAERFVEIDLPGGPQRLYRTGDLAAWRHDGALRYLGRTDDQVKVRGQRVELGEIEAVLAGVAGIAGLAVGVVDERLVAWFVPTAGQGAQPGLVQALQEHARAALPEGWVPAHFVAVQRIPLGTSGKTDRRTLAETAPPVLEASGGDAPGTLLEQRLCGIVADVLDTGAGGSGSGGRGGRAVSPTTDFFDAGGDSLAALRLLSRIEDDLGVRLSLPAVFAEPTPAALATALAELLDADDAAVDDGTGEVLTLRAAPDSDRAPLFLLPPAGGLGWCYTGLLTSLPGDQPVHALQLPGIGTGLPASYDDLEAMARAQLATIERLVGDGPFHVAGWSLGGMAAHGVAALARAAGHEVGAVVALDAYPSEQWQHLSEPTEAEALRGVLRMGGVEGLLVEGAPIDREVVADVLRAGGSALAALPDAVLAGCIASVVGAARLVRTSTHPVLAGDLHVVVATAPRPETWLDASGWTSCTTGAVRVHEVAATHGDLVRRPAVAQVGRILTDLLG